MTSHQATDSRQRKYLEQQKKDVGTDNSALLLIYLDCKDISIVSCTANPFSELIYSFCIN